MQLEDDCQNNIKDQDYKIEYYTPIIMLQYTYITHYICCISLHSISYALLTYYDLAIFKAKKFSLTADTNS